MTSYPVLQRYDNTAILTLGGGKLIPDSANNRFFAFKDGSRTTSGAGIYRFDTASGLQTGLLTAATMFAADSGNYANVRGPLVLTFNGSIVWSPSDAVPGAGMAVVDASSMTLTGRMGSASAALIQTPQSLAALDAGGIDFVLGTNAAHPNIFVMETHGEVCQFAGHRFNTSEAETTLGVLAGSAAAGSGIAYTVGWQTSGPIGLYKTTLTSAAAGYDVSTWPGSPNAHISTSRLSSSINPSDIDAGWSGFVTVSGPVYDASDGNVIISVFSTGGSSSFYLVKLSVVDGSIVWKLADTYIQYLSACNLNGVLWLTNSNVLYEYDTTTGTLTGSTTFDSANAINTTLPTWDGTSLSVWHDNSFFGTSTPPPYLADGTTTGGPEWARYIVGSAPSPPVPPGPVPFPIVSVNRAWAYTMDGHTFYVLDLGAEGTFVYDLDTQQWSQFQTNGGNWSMIAGCMFGDRVVAGDIATDDVWELVPSAMFDSGDNAYEISHVCTGGLVHRSRVYLSCAALRVTASFGQLDDVGGVNMTLRFSDDQGQTWTTPDTIALTEGSYSQEIAWRSLGSFAAPGRIFELSDSGGLIRIDGADAMIEDFDNDKPNQ